MCNLPVVVTVIMRKTGRRDEDTDHGTRSTFGWRVATRTTATMDSGTAMDLTTVNLRDLRGSTAVTNQTLTQMELSRSISVEDAARPSLDHKDDLGAKARQQRSIVWITPEKLHRPDSKEVDGK